MGTQAKIRTAVPSVTLPGKCQCPLFSWVPDCGRVPGHPSENANRFGQDLLWLAKYAFFTRSILFFRLGG